MSCNIPGMEREGAHVLVVDDDDGLRELLTDYLSGHGFRVGAVADGSSAAPACAELEAEVVVIDYRLPDVDGAEVAEAVRDRCPGASVVFLSASAGREEHEAARSSGAPLVRKDEGVDALVDAVRAAAASSFQGGVP